VVSTSSDEHVESATPSETSSDADPKSTNDADQPSVRADPSAEAPFTHTRASGVWAAVVVALLALLVLIVFILENGHDVHISFFGAHGTLPLGVALLLAAVIGGLLVVMAGVARILQLRRRARATRETKRGTKRTRSRRRSK